MASVLATPTPTWRGRFRSALTFAAIVTVMVAPYMLLYVQLTEGLWNYLVTAWGQNQTEADVPLTDIPVHEDERVRILVDLNLQPTSRDAETGWPCFT